MAISDKPLVLICATPLYGHLAPLRSIARALVARGFHVTFLTVEYYRSAVESVGARFAPMEGDTLVSDDNIATAIPHFLKPRSPDDEMRENLTRVFIDTVPQQHASLQRALRDLEERYPRQPVVVLNEGMFMGSLPVSLGAPGLRPAGVIGIGVVPVFMHSVDTPPFRTIRGWKPDLSSAARERNRLLNDKYRDDVMPEIQRTFYRVFEEVGVVAGTHYPSRQWCMDLCYVAPDVFFQMCVPSLEYSRIDAPATLHCVGNLPKDQEYVYENPPAWWDEVVTHNRDKKVVLVSQGSLALNYSFIIRPTIKALASRTDVLVVVALGKKGATLPAEDHPLPSNVRVADFVPYDAILPYCAAFVTNGGFGALNHGVNNATPVILGGDTEDKPEVAGRAVRAGMGYDLGTGSPSAEQVAAAVEVVLADARYKNAAVRVQMEARGCDPVGRIAEAIVRMGSGGGGGGGGDQRT